MSPIRMLARPMLASVFVTTGISGWKDPSYATHVAREAGLSQPEQLAKAHAATNLVAGLMLGTGRLPRLAALALAANLVPTTLLGHAFWSAPADQKGLQQIEFFKNTGLLGGLLLAFADTGGRESLPHAVQRVSHRTTKRAAKAARRAEKRLASAT